MKRREAEKGASSFTMAPLSFHESCHPSQLINFSASPWTSWIIFDNFTFHHGALCHLDCSSRSKLLEGSFLLFFHLANRTSRNAKSEWTPVSYLQNNMGHLRAVKCLCHCFSLVASEVVFSFVATYFCACIIPLPPTAQQRLWGEQKTLFFWHRMPQRAREFGRALQTRALSALQYLDLRQHNLP